MLEELGVYQWLDSTVVTKFKLLYSFKNKIESNKDAMLGCIDRLRMFVAGYTSILQI